MSGRIPEMPGDPFLTGTDGWDAAIQTGQLLGRALFDLADDENALIAALAALDDLDLRDVLLALLTEGEVVVYVDEDEDENEEPGS
jgi:hypothetical protein